MTYLYYQTTSTTGGEMKVNDKTKKQWSHLANKENWRITQLPNGYYQTEVSNPENEDWHDVTRRETLEGAEQAIDGSVDQRKWRLQKDLKL
jgi:hypothetical protein